MCMSNKKCCVPGCIERGSHKVLHAFPNPEKDIERFRTWLLSIGGDLIGLEKEGVYKYRRVCHAHFEEKYCCRYDRISNIAVPTLNMPEETGVSSDHSYTTIKNNRNELTLKTIPTSKVRKPTRKRRGFKNIQEEPIQTVSVALNEIPVYSKINDNANSESSETKLPTVEDSETDDVQSSQEKSTENENTESKSEVLARFSWQTDHVPDLQDVDDPVYLSGGNEHHSPIIDLDVDDDDDDIQDISTHEYKCNACQDAIKSDRFACAQCVDYDLCAQCAGERAAHRQHYLLRVPPRRPPAEVQLVLQKVRELLMSVTPVGVPLVDNTKETEIKMEVKDEEEAIEDPLNVEETLATVPDMDDDNLEPHQEGDTSTDTLNVEDKSDEIVTTRLTLINETHKRTYKNVRVHHSSPPKKKRCIIVVKKNSPVLKCVENTLPVVTSSSTVQTDTEESSTAHSAPHRVTGLHRPPDSTIPLLQDIQQTRKAKQILLQTVKHNDKVLLNLKNLRIVKVQKTPDKT